MKPTSCPAHHRSRAASREWPSRPANQITASPRRQVHGREFFSRVVKQLKLRLPPNRPVTVLASRQLSKKSGDCSIARGKFQIRVCKSLNEAEAIECLLHEWAHALSWRACVGTAAKSRSLAPHEFDRLGHGAPWGLAYSKVYLCFTSEIVLTLKAEDLNAAVARGRRGRP
jgi:hypothetical protein